MPVTEKDLVYPALLVIDNNPGISMGELIGELESIFQPQGVDAEILDGRRDTKFSQKVRNLVSHDTLLGPKLVTSADATNRKLGRTFTITPQGRASLLEKKDDLEALLVNGFSYDTAIDAVKEIAKDKPGKYLDENLVIQEGARKRKSVAAFERSIALREAAVNHYAKDGKLSCVVCNFDFEEKYGDLGKGYIEIHHEQPLFYFDGEKPEISLREAVKTVKPLCSNCHRMIHLGPRNKQMSIDELKAKLKQPE